jgi:hypothetical protein
MVKDKCTLPENNKTISQRACPTLKTKTLTLRDLRQYFFLPSFFT